MIYFGYMKSEIDDGGSSRNSVIWKDFKEKKFLSVNIYSKNKLIKLLKSCMIIFLLSVLRNKKIIIHYTLIPSMFISNFFKYKSYKNFCMRLLKKCIKKNKIIFEINDLPYEQAIDLEIELHDYWLEIETIIFNSPTSKYIFASYTMKDYIIEKYKIKKENVEVLINGGGVLNKELLLTAKKYINENDKIKYIYAGSLNKGRQIEELIEIFQEKTNVELYLIGIWGEWIKDKGNNIIYLGNFEESMAHAIVHSCDVGIIPYDENRFYYNLCYPTKASFYITAGIPFLCTNLKELKNIFEKKNVSWFKNIGEWQKQIEIIDEKKVKEKKENIKYIKNDFLWNSLVKKIDFEKLL